MKRLMSCQAFDDAQLLRRRRIPGKMRTLCGTILAAFTVMLSSSVFAAATDPFAGEPEGERIALWPEGKMPSVEEHQCNNPFIEWFVPSNKTTDAVFVETCGGGYNSCHWVPKGSMGGEFRDWLLEKGMTVVRFHYRTPRPKKVAKHITAWQDAQRAIRLVRAGAAAHGVNPGKIGFSGFSAAGHLALLMALSSQTNAYEPTDEIDALPCNIAFAVAQCPAYLLADGADGENAHGGDRAEDVVLPEFKFDSGTCPVFFMHGDADGISPMGSVKVYSRLHAMHVPCDLHVFAKRVHDFKTVGLSKENFTPVWRKLLWDWLAQLGFCSNASWEANGKGALVLSFDDRNLADWERAIPLFDKYGAHATFFFVGPVDTSAAPVLKKLRDHGHSIGLHGLKHLNADAAFAAKGAETYFAEEVEPQLAGCRAAGIPITSYAYPNCRRTDETDELFRTNGFKHVRGGLKGVTPHDPKGEKQEGLKPVHTVDRAFSPTSELKTRFRLDTAIAGEAYHTDIEDILKCVRRCAERNEAFVLTSHGIHKDAKQIHMKTEWLERILATAKECGVPCLGFDEL